MTRRLIKTLVLCFSLITLCTPAAASSMDSLRKAMEEHRQVQEKVYIHTDNSCYFVGDTIWYKAYVLRADSLKPTDMSKILYVELLSPDGLVVERQRVVIGNVKAGCGQFILHDSLYSGYYEIRAYTRWMLNFNVSEKMYTRSDREAFYSNQMAKDFFRDWAGLYSRVLPIYSRPTAKGDFDLRRMYSRPKQELVTTPADELKVKFYPEGGNLVQGLPNRIAFECTDQQGQAVNISGNIAGQSIRTTYMGRGTFEITPTGEALKAVFNWKGKDWTFKLPKTQDEGVTMRISQTATDATEIRLSLNTSKLYQGKDLAVVTTCRGLMNQFLTTGGKRQITIRTEQMPSGVNELLVMTADGDVLASRMLFVNHNDRTTKLKATTDQLDYQPYSSIDINITGGEADAVVSIALRDAQTDEPTYDTGDMLQEMLLTSDLKGFVANPKYYFEANDAEHLNALDMLLLVQGWRKYQPVRKYRYQPERYFTIEGSVNKMLGLSHLDMGNIDQMNRQLTEEERLERISVKTTNSDGEKELLGTSGEDEGEQDANGDDGFDPEQVFAEGDNVNLGVNHGTLKKEVYVEAEVNKGGQTAGSVQMTNNGGRFLFQVPAFYDDAILFIKAYSRKDSLKRNMQSHNDKKFMDEDSYPDYYVKLDMFYPVFAHPYSYYQTHQPLNFLNEEKQQTTHTDMQDGVYLLKNVNVDAKRRGRRGVDYSKPAYIADAYELYNEVTDRGLSWGIFNISRFPHEACKALYGNMGRHNSFNIRTLLNGRTIDIVNYEDERIYESHMAKSKILKDTKLKRIKEFRFYTDFEPRNADIRLSESVNREDIAVQAVNFADDMVQYTYRDRRYVMHGFVYPEQMYQPDYSKAQPKEPTDYRRTLYWNPNAHLDANGTFNARAYNNCRETRVKLSVAGMTEEGKFVNATE